MLISDSLFHHFLGAKIELDTFCLQLRPLEITGVKIFLPVDLVHEISQSMKHTTLLRHVKINFIDAWIVADS